MVTTWADTVEQDRILPFLWEDYAVTAGEKTKGVSLYSSRDFALALS